MLMMKTMVRRAGEMLGSEVYRSVGCSSDPDSGEPESLLK